MNRRIRCPFCFWVLGAIMDQMMTVAEIAKRLKVSLATVYAMVESGEIPCYRIRTRPGKRGAIRFTEAQLQDYLKAAKFMPSSSAPSELRHIRLPS